MRKFILISLVVIFACLKTFSQDYKLEAKKIVFETAKYLAVDNYNNPPSKIDTKLKNNCIVCSGFDFNTVSEIDSLLLSIKESCFKVFKFDASVAFIDFYLDSAKTIKTKDELKGFKDDIKTKLENEKRKKDPKFKPFTNKIDSIALNAKEPEIKQNDNNVSNNHVEESPDNPIFVYKTKTWIIVLIVLLLVLTIILCYFVVKINSKLANIIRKSSNMLSEEKFNSTIFELKSETNKKMSNEVEKFNDKILLLEKKINEQNQKRIENIVHTENKNVTTFNQETLYAQYPDSNSPIGFSRILEPDNPRKIYKIIVKELNKGEFSLTTNEELQEYAIDNHNNMLKPACEYSNQLNSSYKKFQIISNGLVEKVGNIWQITKKANIRFI